MLKWPSGSAFNSMVTENVYLYRQHELQNLRIEIQFLYSLHLVDYEYISALIRVHDCAGLAIRDVSLFLSTNMECTQGIKCFTFDYVVNAFNFVKRTFLSTWQNLLPLRCEVLCRSVCVLSSHVIPQINCICMLVSGIITLLRVG